MSMAGPHCTCDDRLDFEPPCQVHGVTGKPPQRTEPTMPNPLTPEQIELLRSLPARLDDLPKREVKTCRELGLAAYELYPNSAEGTYRRGHLYRTPKADLLIVTLYTETERAVTAERERVAGVVDDVASTHHMLPTFEVIRELRRALSAATPSPQEADSE